MNLRNETAGLISSTIAAASLRRVSTSGCSPTFSTVSQSIFSDRNTRSPKRVSAAVGLGLGLLRDENNMDVEQASTPLAFLKRHNEKTSAGSSSACSSSRSIDRCRMDVRGVSSSSLHGGGLNEVVSQYAEPSTSFVNQMAQECAEQSFLVGSDSRIDRRLYFWNLAEGRNGKSPNCTVRRTSSLGDAVPSGERANCQGSAAFSTNCDARERGSHCSGNSTMLSPFHTRSHSHSGEILATIESMQGLSIETGLPSLSGDRCSLDGSPSTTLSLVNPFLPVQTGMLCRISSCDAETLDSCNSFTSPLPSIGSCSAQTSSDPCISNATPIAGPMQLVCVKGLAHYSRTSGLQGPTIPVCKKSEVDSSLNSSVPSGCSGNPHRSGGVFSWATQQRRRSALTSSIRDAASCRSQSEEMDRD